MSDRIEITIMRQDKKFKITAGPLDSGYHEATVAKPLDLAKAIGDIVQEFFTTEEYERYMDQIRIESKRIQKQQRKGF